MIVAICPTYKRPHLIGNVIAMWQRQICDVPRHLLILDDAPSFAHDLKGDNWTLRTRTERYPFLGAKFAAMTQMAIEEFGARYVVLFEDDDVYFPHYLQHHLDVLQGGADLSIPSRIHTNYRVGKGKSVLQDNKFGHHGAWAFTADIYLASKGYPQDRTEGFNSIMRDHLLAAGAQIGDCSQAAPQYLFRWFTASRNGSGFGKEIMTSQDNNPLPLNLQTFVGVALDDESREFYQTLGFGEVYHNDLGDVHKALVVFVDRVSYLVHQTRALYQSLLYSNVHNTDLICFGPKDALDAIPDGPLIKKCIQEAHPIALQYGFINSLSCFNGNGHEILDDYDYLLKTDVDTFITPAWNNFCPKDFTCGVGQYANNLDVKSKIVEFGRRHGYNHRGKFNLGATFWGSPSAVKQICKTATELTEILIQDEFSENHGIWPGWFRGVSSMYATDIAINHYIPGDFQIHSGLDFRSCADDSIYKHPHIHCWHMREDYSKHKWIDGAYQDRTEDGLNLAYIPDYCLAMALRAK